MNYLDERFLVADILAHGGTLAGFCSYDESQIFGLYIHPAWTGRGLASLMMDHAESAIIATGRHLIGISASGIARPLYEKRGYVVWRRRGWKTRGGLVVEAFDMEKPVGLAGRTHRPR